MNSVFTFLLLMSCGIISAQETLIFDSIHYPLKTPITLSGTFGEIRSNHFHSGIDIKTGGIQGEAVYSIYDGYVSRVKVSGTGFGKAIYIDHPNGTTSVYAHLKNFNKAITEYVKSMQYANQTFEIDLYPNPNRITLEKGDFIAYSGNSGSSEGPHLHFEIRDSKTQIPRNPLNYNINITDNIKPIINSLCVYGANKEKQCVDVINSDLNYYIKDTIFTDSLVSFSVETYDKHNYTPNKNGIYSIKLFVDDSLIHYRVMDSFSFSETRYVNSLIDYQQKDCCNKIMQKCFLDERNNLNIYNNLKNGWTTFLDTLIHEVKFIICDKNNNCSELLCYVKAKNRKLKNVVPQGIYIESNKIQQLSFNEVELYFPYNCFYNNFYFEFSKENYKGELLSPIYNIHNTSVPVHQYYILSLNLDVNFNLKHKITLAKVNSNDKIIYMGGSWSNNTFITKLNTFGKFALTFDTIPPIIKPQNIYNGKNMKENTVISFKIFDDFSGINNYRAEVDGKWILMEYDPKNSKLVYYFDEKIEKGKHSLTLHVTDKLNNASVYKAEFIR